MGGPCHVDGQSRQELDNFYTCQIEAEDGIIWPSSEHYYQGSKYLGNEKLRGSVRTASDGMASWQLGNQHREAIRKDWEEVKVDIMYEANLAKFSQCSRLRELLVNRHGPIEAQGNLRCWKTWNEVLLERIREELRTPNSRNQTVLTQRIAAMAAYRAAASAKDSHAIEVAVKYASLRKPIPETGCMTSLRIQGAGKDLDGIYRVDQLCPEVNGQAHYVNDENHVILGSKRGAHAWVLDSCFSPNEVTGAAYLAIHGQGELPLGSDTTWKWFDGQRHVDRILTIQTCS